jgi:hypothetical protein
MTETVDLLVRAFLIGIGATAMMDIWANRMNRVKNELQRGFARLENSQEATP